MWADPNASLSSADKKIYDVEALKEQLVALRLQRLDVKKQRSRVQKEVSELETTIAPLKQHYNILMQLNELRFAVDEEQNNANADNPGDGNDDGGDEGDAKPHDPVPKLAENRFKLIDKKLEIQVLNQEIKSVLGKLEKAALELETSIYPLEKEAKLAQESLGNVPVIFCATSDELDAMIGDNIEARLVTKSTAQQDAMEAERKKISLASDILRARETLSMLIDERECMKQANERVRRSFLSEQATIKKLTDQARELRERIGVYHKGRGWETEAFVGVVGSIHGRLEKQLIRKALLPWTPLDKVHRLASVHLLVSRVKDMNMDYKEEMKGGEREGEGEGKEGEEVKDINFRQFCEICDLFINQSSQ